MLRFLVRMRALHASAEPAGGARILRLKYRPGFCVIHFNYVNAGHFLQKLNRYTDIEAQQAKERGEKASPTKLLLRPIAEFLKRYLYRQGFRDGWNGFYYCLLMLVYKLTVAIKLRELECDGASEAAQ